MQLVSRNQKVYFWKAFTPAKDWVHRVNYLQLKGKPPVTEPAAVFPWPICSKDSRQFTGLIAAYQVAAVAIKWSAVT
jgi:hypothetical protein